MIPKLIHQTAKTNVLDPELALYQEILLKFHPDWSCKLWTDDDNIDLLKQRHPDLESVYLGMPRSVMKADLMRYVYMNDFGGLYLDLDYQFLKPFDLNSRILVLPRESNDGAPIYLGNCIFASAPRHPFWKALLDAIRRNPPTKNTVKTENDTIDQSGPGKVTEIWHEQFEQDTSIFIPPRSWFHPVRPETDEDLRRVASQPETYGVHWCVGSWRALTFRSRLKNQFKRILHRG
jgi:mannosyltransferase OCH1-like enzyme